jgi:hypothetical protein
MATYFCGWVRVRRCIVFHQQKTSQRQSNVSAMSKHHFQPASSASPQNDSFSSPFASQIISLRKLCRGSPIQSQISVSSSDARANGPNVIHLNMHPPSCQHSPIERHPPVHQQIPNPLRLLPVFHRKNVPVRTPLYIYHLFFHLVHQH